MYSRKFSSIMKNVLTRERAFCFAHDVEELLPGLEEIHEPALPAEERRGRAEIAAHRTADRRDDCGGGIAAALRHPQAHQPGAERGPDGRMVDRCVDRLAEKLAEPPDPFAFDDVVRLEHPLEAGDRRHMAADDDRRFRGVLPDQTAHLAHLADVDDDARDADHVVMVGREFLDEALARRKVEQGGRRGNVLLDQHDAPRAMMHPERERPLRSRHLVVIELKRIDRSAAKFVILRKGPKYGAQQDARVTLL